MKAGALKTINISLFVLLTIGDVVLIINCGLSNEGWLLIALASFFFIMYFWGCFFPNHTATLIYRLSKKIYRNSNDIQIPIVDEAKKTFKKRLPYLLVIVNILMLLLMLTMLFKT